ncbi:alanine--tRNA ligase [Candidatus Pacearchaeota archaeon]|nr:MAG: alanine--tRNA ligase [Candidatus Pacearchaeota archaeon]
MNRKELIRKYLEFFKSKQHKQVPNASLIPENDPTVLFTTAGMHPLVPYLLGQKHPLGKRLVSVQRCIRTGDIGQVGDKVHHTFFEMLGNWSLGDYWKKEAIHYTFEFLTKILKIPKNKLAVTCFKGDKDSPKDTESAEIWKSHGIPEERIAFLGKKENWWQLPGEGPCGPDTETFYWASSSPVPKKFDPEDKNWVEIGNNVLMQYYKDKKGNYKESSQKNIDFGGGVERIITSLNNEEDEYLTDSFLPLIKEIEKVSRKEYKNEETKRAMRIIADHVKASVFIIADGVTPSNTERGYVLRRLIRRAVRYGNKLNAKSFIVKIAEPVFEIYDDYPHLQKNKKQILQELEKEEQKFLKTLEKGLNRFKKLVSKKKELSGKDSFLLYQSFGFPLEMIEEEAQKAKIKFDRKDFEAEQKKHQELSKTALTGKYKSGLADNSEETKRLHTAAHLLLSALRKVLKNENIIQRGSNITPERLRLDFSFPRKITKEELKKIEDLVNEKIQQSLEVVKEEKTLEEAKKQGALGIFEEKYGEKVSVYTIGDFSKEICAGPHVKNTKELGHFKIIKEESSGAGVRRIKAVLE